MEIERNKEGGREIVRKGSQRGRVHREEDRLGRKRLEDG